jgi:hypothetical protein
MNLPEKLRKSQPMAKIPSEVLWALATRLYLT